VSRVAAIRRGSLKQDFRGRGRPWGIFFGFYKTRHILLSDNANCTVLRAVVLTQYRRVTDRQTDGIAVASTALAMRALRRAVKNRIKSVDFSRIFIIYFVLTKISWLLSYGSQCIMYQPRKWSNIMQSLAGFH